ncbi:MAG: HNH endonuclease [Acidimicrobiia bacterium]|nr:HNH endonuclease [Acidimicrobiia bacterium]MCY4433777.1 DUF222 domain-containing protein [bacterium]
MDFGAVTCGNGGGGVCVEAVDVASLDDASLDARLRLIGQGRNRLEGFLAEVVAEKTRRSSSFDALNSLKGELRQSGHQAQRTMRSADQLEKLEATRDALVDSRINSEHARILGSAAESGPMDEAKMLAAAETQSPEQLRKTVRDHQNELADDDGAKRLERQRKKRTASFTERDDGMWQLFALFDPSAAAGIRVALNKATDDDWRQDNRREHTADRHRRADALERLITRTVSNGGHEQPQGTTLLLMASYDLVDNKLGNPRLADGTPLPAPEFHRLACDADILTGLFREADSEPIWMGSTSRHPNFALRVALEARDQGCIGCAKAPEWCVSHHIVEWQDGGPTQPDNLVLVCHDCHQKVHYRNWAVEKHPDTGRRHLRPPWQEPPKPQFEANTPLRL